MDGRTSDRDRVRETTRTEISLRESLPTTSLAPVPTTGTSVSQATTRHKGQGPPSRFLYWKDPELRLDDWIPALLRASKWYGWSEDEVLIQLAGHLRGRALQEWNLLPDEEKCDRQKAVKALRERLNPGGKAWQHRTFGIQHRKEMSLLLTISGAWSVCFRLLMVKTGFLQRQKAQCYTASYRMGLKNGTDG